MKYDLRHRRPNLFRQRKPRGPLLPISLVALALLIALFSLIRPFELGATFNPSNVTVPPYTPTPTPVPTPTSIHGGHIVFTCRRKEVNQICMVRADGSGYAQLTHETTNAYYPAISPDLRTVVFALNQYDLFNLNVLTLKNNDVNKLADQIGNSFSPDFSPDGKQVVFVNRVGTSPSAVWIVGSDGKNPHLLYQGPKD